jgi:peptide/nickel transport system substrate-binding protein
MRRSKALAALAGVAMITLAACGGSGTNDSTGDGDGGFQQADEGLDKNPNAPVPAPEIEGAQTGGTITVYLSGDPGPADLDPTGGWSVTGNSIQQDLVNRSLTQFYRDPETGKMTLVPDLATDLGTPNEDFTEWTFTIRDDVKWETGEPVTAEQVAFGISRSLDVEKFPGGPGTSYSVGYFDGADKYTGPYSSGKPYQGITVNGQDITIKMSKAFPDMDYWGSFMAMGPVPSGKTGAPPKYGLKPLSTGPYKVESFRSGEELVLVKNDQWDAATDAARHQFADKWIFKFNQDQKKVDEIMLSGNTDSQAAISTSIGSDNYAEAKDQLGDRLFQQSAQCTSFQSPDYSKITDINVRKAIAYAYPYEDVWTAGGEVPGVTRVYANSIMPPGMSGKKEFFVDGEQIKYDPEKSKELLAEAGYEPGEFKLTFIFYEPDALAVAAKDQLVVGLEEGGFSTKAIPTQDSPYDTWLDPDSKLNKQLNLRGVNWCADWPSGLTMVPELTRGGATYNTSFFNEPSIDEEMAAINELPLEEQAAAWGDIDEKILTEYFPIIPTAFRNDLFVFGEKIGYGVGDATFGAPYYKGIFVAE